MVWDTYDRFYLKSLASYLFLAHSFDKMQSLSNSRTQILAHQVEATYRVVQSICPRFLIADEVGLGKTIEAGLIIKEFILRHNYNKICIIVPTSLQFQWQTELEEKFNEKFQIVDLRYLKKNKNRLPDKVLLSIDFAKQDNIKAILLKKKWNVVVFDESHRLRRDRNSVTKAYHLAEDIGSIPKVFLLLSATPFSGKLEELFYLLRLLNPSLLGTLNNFTLDYVINKKSDLHEKIAPVLIRRRKIEIGGFTQRLVKTFHFDFSAEEQELYRITSDYIKNEYNKAVQGKNRFYTFIMIVYQKMLDSSSYAIIQTVIRRIKYIELLLDSRQLVAEKVKKEHKRFLKESGSLESPGEISMEKMESLVEKYVDKAIDELQVELLHLKEIYQTARHIKTNRKGEALKEFLNKVLKENPEEKILIFTQFRRTQDYLSSLLNHCRISLFYGGLDKVEKDRIINEFKSSTNILISTEAGGEGRNLQFCRYLVNYDLPWSPLKIEQRIGRLHRFGQKKNVQIINFVCNNTIGAKIIDILEYKIKAFESSIGEMDTLLGFYENEINFDKIFMNILDDEANTVKDLDNRLQSAKEHFKYLNELMTHRSLDFNLDLFYETTRNQRRINNRLIYQFVRKYAGLKDSSCTLRSCEDGPGLYRLDDQDRLEKFKGYFDSKQALQNPDYDFFAFGHAYVNRMARKARELSFLGLTSRIVQTVPGLSGPYEGIIFNFIVTYRNNRIYQEFCPVFIDKHIEIDFTAEDRLIQEYLKFNFSPDTQDLPEWVCPEKTGEIFNKALLFLEYKIQGRLDEIKEKLAQQIGKEVPVINKYYDRVLSELARHLELQKNKERVYDLKTMKGLIKRTENKIKSFKEKKIKEMDRLRDINDVFTSYSLLNLAVCRFIPEK